MHILMVAPQPFFRPRGTPFSVLHRIRGLSMLGHTVDLVTYPFGSSPEVSGLRIHRSARPPLVRDVAVGPSFRKVLLDVPLFRDATRMATRGSFDLIHTHEEAGWLGARLRRMTGVPHLYDMHSSLPQQLENFGRFHWPPLIEAFRRLEAYTLRGSDGVIAICQELHEHVVATGYSRPLAMIENTLDFEAVPVTDAVVADLRVRLDIGDGPVVVYTGTLEPYQGLDLLLAAAAEVRRRVPGARFVVVGGDTAQASALRQSATAAGVAELFRIEPAVPPEDVPAYHALADVLVTTRARGTNVPLKVYQYLRAERPIVATAIRAHTQVLDPGIAELVTPEPQAIAAGLLRVLGDAAHARGLAHASAATARERYSEARYLERLDDVVRRVAGARPADDSRGGRR
jgi:glycosyltransferase involved in cell wall biosynthesis